jgi:hypothetical protein
MDDFALMTEMKMLEAMQPILLIGLMRGPVQRALYSGFDSLNNDVLKHRNYIKRVEKEIAESSELTLNM